MLDIYTLVIVLIVFWISFHIVRNLASSSGKSYPPTVRWALPVLGHLPYFGSNPPITFKEWRNQYGDIYTIRIGSLNTVVVNGRRHIQEAMLRKGDELSDRPRTFTKDAVKKVYGGIESFILHPFNQSYLQTRKIVINVLHKVTHTNLTETQELILEETVLLLQEFSRLKSKPQCVHQAIRVAVNRIIYQILFGRGKCSRDDTRLQNIVESANEIVELNGGGNPFDVMPWLQYLMPWRTRRFLRIMGTAVGIVRQELEEHLKDFDKSHIKDVTDMLLATELPKGTTDETVLTKDGLLLPVLNELMQGGQETVSATLEWLILHMAAYPDVQERIHTEIDETVGADRSIDIMDKPHLCYTEATIYETMRISNADPFAFPHSALKNTKLAGFDIDKGTMIFINQHSANMDEKVWNDPEVFRPQRLLTDQKVLDHDNCNNILLFGLGRRRCVGEQLAQLMLFIVFSNLMQRFTFRKAAGGIIDLTPIPGLVYKPKFTEIIITER